MLRMVVRGKSCKRSYERKVLQERDPARGRVSQVPQAAFLGTCCRVCFVFVRLLEARSFGQVMNVHLGWLYMVFTTAQGGHKLWTPCDRWTRDKAISSRGIQAPVSAPHVAARSCPTGTRTSTATSASSGNSGSRGKTGKGVLSGWRDSTASRQSDLPCFLGHFRDLRPTRVSLPGASRRPAWLISSSANLQLRR